jgi:hypothetical protein
MRKIFFLTTAAGLAVASLAAYADSAPRTIALAMNGEAGKAGVSSSLTKVKADSKLYDYCAKVIDDVKKGKSSSRSSSYSTSDCIEIFVSAGIPAGMTAAEPGQPGRGGDGGGIAGMPGGKGGAAGEPGQDGGSLPGAPGGMGGAAGGASMAEVDENLLDYCSAVLKQQSRSSTRKPVESDEYELSDCVDYFASLDASNGGTDNSARDGASGPSISGGQGGAGGKRGAGPGGASGGAGGAGVAGGTGGKGGAGGSGY